MAKLKTVLFDLDDTPLPEMVPENEALLVACGLAADRYDADTKKMLDTVDESCRRLWAQWKTPIVYSEIAYSVWEDLCGPADSAESNLGNDSDTITKYKREVWDEVLASYGIEDADLRDEIIKLHRIERLKRLKPFADAIDVIEQVKEQYPIAIVTNGSPTVQRIKLNESGLAGYFDVVVASGDVGFGKPKPEPFNSALEQLNVRPEEAVMIGNSWGSDIKGASNLGMPSIWFNVDQKSRPDDGFSPTIELDSLKKIPEAVSQIAN
ncbi:MAG: HAD family hydrolase [Chloroflexi bacterium]|nr:HAD family hydrolase [Chloroflexota bacterium]MDA1281202.1 HAD family hydrolase [Chloroflexota bacterium]